MAQAPLTTLRGSLPLMGAVSEVKRWETTVSGGGKRQWTPMTLGLLIGGGVLVLASLMGLMLSGGRLTGVITLLEALIPAALGMAALFRAGMMYAKPATPATALAVRDEFLIDPEKVWHHLRGAALLADDALQKARDRAAIQRRPSPDVELTGTKLDPRQVELMSNLLESACAIDNADSREMVEAISFYLHGAGIDVVNDTAGHEGWFEFLPAPAPGTLRPALVAGEKLVRKGLAAR